MLIRLNDLNNSSGSLLESLEFIKMDRKLLEIPLIESNNNYILNLESLSEFCNHEGLYEVIDKICSINEVSKDQLLFSIYDSSILNELISEEFIEANKERVLILNKLNESNDSFIANTLSNIDKILQEEFFQGKAIQHGKMWDTPDELVDLVKGMNDDIERNIKALFSAKSEEEFDMIKGAIRGGLVTEKLEGVTRRHYQKEIMKDDPFAKLMAGGEFGSNMPSQNAMLLKDQQDWIDHIEAEKFPKSKLAQMIQKLRGLYQGIMHKWGRGIDYKVDPRIPTAVKDKIIAAVKMTVKRLGSMILRIIDKLLRALQKGADKASDAVGNFVGKLKNASNTNASPAPAMA